MRIERAYKTELDPTSEQVSALLRHAGAARFAYNWGLRRKMDAYNSTGETPSAMDLHRELNHLKRTDFPWLYEVSKCAPQEALRDLDKAFKSFFRDRGRLAERARAAERLQGRMAGLMASHASKERGTELEVLG